MVVRRSRASTGVFEVLINSTISSMLAKATAIPSKVWDLSRAFLSSNSDRLVTISWRCFKKHSSSSNRLRVFGCPSTKATIFTPNTTCIWVCRYKLFKKTSAFSPRLNSITTLVPSLSDSSRKPSAVIPSNFFSWTNSAIFSMNLDLFT